MNEALPHDPVRDYALANRPQLIDTLTALVACPSVGADPDQAAGMEAARQVIEARLSDMGFHDLQRLHPADGTGQPSLYAAHCQAPGKPTLLIYAHYDVQPPDPTEAWETPPFAVTDRDGRLYGRGISDDKGPMMIALETLAAFLAVEGTLPINVKFLIEGEEETGSPSIPGILEQHRALLAADAVLSADGARWRPDLVTLNVGARGSTGFEVRLRTASQDLHSGRFGGVVANPLHVLARLIASLHDDRGRIAAPGFYDGVTEPTEAERTDIAALPVDADSPLTDVGAVSQGEAGYTTLERLWLRPTLDVNGLWGGYTGAGAKTVIPHQAQAKLTIRLVQDQCPEAARAAVIAHLRAQLPRGATLEITGAEGGTGASTVPPDHPLLRAASAALTQTTGSVPRKVRIGATLPLSEIVKRVLGIDTVMFSFATADENFHAPNEFFRSSAIDEGLTAWVAILRQVATQDPAEFVPKTATPIP